MKESFILFHQVQRLRQRAKRQGETGRGSRESLEVPKEDEVILSLKKKYEDLLQYVLKVLLVVLVCVTRRLRRCSLRLKNNEQFLSVAVKLQRKMNEIFCTLSVYFQSLRTT